MRVDSTNPPDDTAALVEAIEAVLDATAGIEHRRVVGMAPAVNLAARTRRADSAAGLCSTATSIPFRSARPGDRPPLGADLEGERIYGRGEVALVGDEETGGRRDAERRTGSLRVICVGEKGNVWVELEATGVANHAAHVHLGRNAVEALVDALGSVPALAALAPSLPAAVERTIAEAQSVSEAESGEGEAETLRRITVNIGRIEGGIGVNTISDRARALCDIRIPPGVTVDQVKATLVSAIDPHPDVSWRILECTESSWTDPEEEIVRAVHENAAAVTGWDVVVNLRAGFSDARFYRHAGVPSVVYGVAPNGIGGADEYATVEDLKTMFAVHTLAGFDYLKGD